MFSIDKSKFLISIIFCLVSFAYSQTCGTTPILPSINGNFLNKIVNGDRAVPNSWPWIVSLRTGSLSFNSHFCAGSLIDANTIITAAHCVIGRTSFFVVAGSNSLNERLILGINAFTARWYRIHQSYNSFTFANDIAIIKLASNIPFTSKIRTICLPSNNQANTIFNKHVVVAGWGATSGSIGNQFLSNNLLQAKLKVLTDPVTCRGFQAQNYCALDQSTKNSNICQGDSGGPLMHFIDNRWFLYGISSFVSRVGNNNCVNSLPSFHTIVPNYLNWISINRV